MSRFCVNCGTPAAETNTFCSGCGAKLSAPLGPPGPGSATPAPGPTTQASAPVWQAPGPQAPAPSMPAPARAAPLLAPMTQAPVPSHGHRGGPIHIPTRPNPSYIVSGILLMTLAAWLGLSFLPAHAPLDEFDLVSYGAAGVLNKDPDAIARVRTWHLPTVLYRTAWVITILIFAGGVQSVVRGALWRDHVEAWCPTCNQTIAAQKREWGEWCPHHNGWAALDRVKITVAISVLVLLFISTIYAMVALS
jgi:hypothetical protein